MDDCLRHTLYIDLFDIPLIQLHLDPIYRFLRLFEFGRRIGCQPKLPEGTCKHYISLSYCWHREHWYQDIIFAGHVLFVSKEYGK